MADKKIMKFNERVKKIRNKIKQDEFEKDDEGNVLVKINITDADSLLSVYNDDGMEIISSETATFIDNVTKPIPPQKELNLHISCDRYTKEKEQIYKNAITNYYVNEFAHTDNKLKNNLIISLILFFVAVVCFTFLYFMGKWNATGIAYLLFDVLSWVFAWEAFDQFFLQRHFLRAKQRKQIQIIFAKITFKKLK